MFSDAPSADMEGLSFVLTENNPLVGIRLENAVTEGKLEEWAIEIIETVGSYAEYGPEETNILLFAQGPLLEGAERSSDVEMVEKERVFAITGDRLEQTPTRRRARKRSERGL
jgi:primase-polymerase (primpol)-like protein